MDVRWLGRVDYATAWDIQRAVHAEVADAGPGSAAARGVLLLCEHDPVYTCGRRTSPADRPVGDVGAPVLDVDRGGSTTWHGPGQLVAYPVVRLPTMPGSGLVDVVAHVRRVEAAATVVCAALGVATTRVAGRSGVWVPGDDVRPARKVAAVGVRVARRTTLHGLSLNCACDLAWFDRVVPCGIRDAGVTTLSVETGRMVRVDDVREQLADALVAGLATTGDAPAARAPRREDLAPAGR